MKIWQGLPGKQASDSYWLLVVSLTTLLGKADDVDTLFYLSNEYMSLSSFTILVKTPLSITLLQHAAQPLMIQKTS